MTKKITKMEMQAIQLAKEFLGNSYNEKEFEPYLEAMRPLYEECEKKREEI